MDASNNPTEEPLASGSVEETLRDLMERMRTDFGEIEHHGESVDILARRLGRRCARTETAVAGVVERLLSAKLGGQTLPAPVLLTVIQAFEDELRSGDDQSGAARERPFANSVTRLAALRRINQAATASLDLGAMLKTVVAVVRETMSCDSCSIFLLDEANSILVLSASVGLNPQATGRVFLPLGSGITGQAATRRQILAIPDATVHPNYVDYPVIGDQRYSSQVSVPLALRSPDRLVGVLNILSLDRREFDADELAFLETAAGEMAIAIENARLYSQTDAELQRRISQLSTLQQMSRMVASTLELSELLQLISEQTMELSNAVAVEIYRQRRGQSGRMELLSRHSVNETCPLDAVSDDVGRLIDDVMGTNATMWRTVDSVGFPLYVHGLPMLTGRRVVGAICVFHTTRPPDDSEASTLLDAFCDSAAIAIENADLYEEARRGYTRASVLLQEMHHRVRNNLQTVAALLSMQARHAEDAGTSTPLREAVTRIQSIAAIHDILSGGDLRETTVDTIAKHVADDATSNLVGPDLRVTFDIEPSPVHVNSREATVLALLVNEFVMNAISHGFAQRSEGYVSIHADFEGPKAVIEIVDDGPGLPEGFSLEANRRLGLNIARTLVETDLRGKLTLQTSDGGGTLVRVVFEPSAGRGETKREDKALA